MTSLGLSRYALTAGAAAALLAGCGAPRAQFAGQGSLPQSRVIATHAARGEGRMLPEAKGKMLVYVSSTRRNDISVLSYPALKKVGHLQYGGGYGLCSDAGGNVFVPSNGGVIYEYAHGGNQPIAELDEGNSFFPNGCSVDPVTGNLAVTDQGGPYCGGSSIAMFAGATGSPTYYCTGTIIDGFVGYCGFDNAGNLYIDGQDSSNKATFAVLPAGAPAVEELTVNHSFTRAAQIQWDGAHITVEDAGRNPKILALKVTGTTATVVGTTVLGAARTAGQSGITGQVVLVPFSKTSSSVSKVGIWDLPDGGNPASSRKVGNRLTAVTVSTPLRSSR
jgi:hypothetical protein